MFTLIRKRKEKIRLFEDLSIFGKLPGMAEFVKSQGNMAVASQVNDAVDHLVNGLQEKQRDILNTLQIQCLFQESAGYHVIQIHHSHDSSGRLYPLTLAGQVQHPLIKQCQPATPIMLLPLKKLMNALQDESQVTSKQEIEQVLKNAHALMGDQSKISVLETEIEMLKNCRQGDWINDCFSGKSHEEIASMIMHISQSMWALRQGELSHLTLPLSPKKPMAYAIYWLQWMDTFLKPTSWPLHYCMVSSAAGAHLYIWFKKPDTLDLTAWVNMPEMTQPTTPYPTGLLSLLNEPDITLCEMIYCWKHEINGGKHEKRISS